MGPGKSPKAWIYTSALSGEPLTTIPRVPPGTRFAAFLREGAPAKGWEARRPRAEHHGLKELPLHQVMSHHYFPGADCTLWVDAALSFAPGVDIERLVQGFLRTGADILAFPHRERNCVYKEAEARSLTGHDDRDLAERQMRRYRELGYPENAGMADCTVLFRLGNNRVKHFNETWEAELRAGSHCETLSFNYAARESGVVLKYLPPEGRRIFRRCPAA